MGYARPAIAAGCAVLVLSVAAVAAVDGGDDPQRVRRGPDGGGRSIDHRTAGVPVPGLSPAQLKAVVQASGSSAESGSRAPSTARVAVPDVEGAGAGASAGAQVTVVRIPGPFTLRALDATVAIDGTDVGPGLLVPDGSAMVAVLTDPTPARRGAVVTYRYGDGAPSTAGTLTGGP